VDVTTAAGSGGRRRLHRRGGSNADGVLGGLLDKASKKREVARNLLGSR
jgi:hypothetical protein